MGLTMDQKHKAFVAAAVVLIIIVVAYAAHHQQWMSKHCVCVAAADTFHGWRGQHYVDNPYNGQNYQCGNGHPDPLRDRFAAGH